MYVSGLISHVFRIIQNIHSVASIKYKGRGCECKFCVHFIRIYWPICNELYYDGGGRYKFVIRGGHFQSDCMIMCSKPHVDFTQIFSQISGDFHVHYQAY